MATARTIVNPVVVRGRGEWEYEEGSCVDSRAVLPELVQARRKIHITGYDLEGKEVSIEADESLPNICCQHELPITSTQALL